jgi:uroporphyrin-III C-methyltransferase/precorrin-2 dehydrogenase/sirohydrochlorin ferrochelatase
VADNPSLCSFIFPSILDRSPVTIAVSTGGASPVLARQLRMKLETMIPSACGRLAGITEEYREKVKQHFPQQEQRKAFWENALKGPFAELVYAGQDTSARKLLDDLLLKEHDENPMGEVYLVGAGPGDPDLLTFKAARLMQQADVMVYDRLVSKPILDMANKNAERLYVGKEKDNHAVPQDQINELLVKLAKQGKRVLRLKGGDPFIFGRGGEEIETLAENKVPFQVVPAITAASGCSSYAGIPLTHRDYAQSVTFATGHLKDGSINLNWQQLTQQNHTIVFYMGLTGINVISEQLQAHGMSGDMPAALVEQGTTRNQRVHIGTVATLPQLVIDSGVRAPTLTIIGEVVQLHDKLHWYEPERHVRETEFSRNV